MKTHLNTQVIPSALTFGPTALRDWAANRLITDALRPIGNAIDTMIRPVLQALWAAVPVPVVAAHFGCDVKWVDDLRLRYGILPTILHARMNPAVLWQLAGAFASSPTATQEELSEACHLSLPLVRAALHAFSLSLPLSNLSGARSPYFADLFTVPEELEPQVHAAIAVLADPEQMPDVRLLTYKQRVAMGRVHKPSGQPIGVGPGQKWPARLDALRLYDADPTKPLTQYWAFFVLCEGHLREGQNMLELRLAARDGNHAAKLAHGYFESEVPLTLHEKPWRGEWYLNICFALGSTAIVRNMEEWGVKRGDKVKNMQDFAVCDELACSVQSIRGCVDANGSVMMTRKGGRDGYPQLTITTPLPGMCKAIDAFLNLLDPEAKAGDDCWRQEKVYVDEGEVGDETGADPDCSEVIMRKCWTRWICGRLAMTLARILYFDEQGLPYEPALKRKQVIAFEMCQADVKPEPTRLTYAQVVDMRTRAANGESTPSIAADHGILVQTVWSVVKRKTYKYIP